MGSEARGWGVRRLLCVVPPASGPWEARTWMSLWALEALGLLPAALVGVERPRVTAAGTAPARPASEVAGFLRVLESRRPRRTLCGKAGPPRGGDPDGAGVAWEGGRSASLESQGAESGERA